jgi:cbb3-type cytochrome oxidase subunit 3
MPITLKKKLILLNVFAIFFLLLSLPVFAQNTPPPTPSGNYGLDTATKGTGLIKKEATPQIIAGSIVSAVLSLLGVLFFLLTIYGGLRWMLSQGNESEVEKAKQIIISAIIGLIVVLSAYAITTFIGNALTK